MQDDGWLEFGNNLLALVFAIEMVLKLFGLGLSRYAGDTFNLFDGFVVLHGTDTMAYTASALSFFLENLGKPVVLTGSQIPICRQRNDGLMNLVGALNVAAFHHIPEACLPPLARPPARNP